MKNFALTPTPRALTAPLLTLTIAVAAALAPTASLASASVASANPAAPIGGGAKSTCPVLLNHRFESLQGEPRDMCAYAGKVVLVVNTASYCGFTKQFEGLEELNARYGPRGLVVMGFPSGDFKQEDADAKKTAEVCFNTYGVKFPMFATGPVRGADAQPIFRQLAQATGQQPSWNFNKYLVGRDGKAVAHFGSMTGPTSGTITAAIEKALALK